MNTLVVIYYRKPLFSESKNKSEEDRNSMKVQKKFIVDILFVLALFGVFTLSALMLVSVGAEVYQHTVNDMSGNYESRTSVSYITEKIRQNDSIISEQNIGITVISGKQALMLTQEMNGEVYYTYLYLHDGYLKELLMQSGSYLGEDTLAAGHKIMKLTDFRLEQPRNDLFLIRLTTSESESHDIFVSTHCTP